MYFGTYRMAGLFMSLSAALHLSTFVVAGFTPNAMVFAMIGVVYAFLAWGVIHALRWVSYLVFLIVIFAISVAIAALGSTAIPNFWLVLIIFAEGMTALNLFVRLWREAGWIRH